MDGQSRGNARSVLRGLAVLATLAAMRGAFPADAAAEPVWLCHPDIPDNPCQPSLETTLVSPTGQVRRVRHVRRERYPRVDCFYVYPTVSDQQTPNANLDIDPEERSVALYQAARYSEGCRVFAPMYRQLTLSGILGGMITGDPQLAYADVVDAWNAYLRSDNDGRGVVLIGHSQGSFVLRQLIAQEIDPNPAERAKLVSAILLGGDVTVRAAQDAGGDFQNVPACRSRRQIGCTVAFSTFDAPVPPNALFGRTTVPGLQVLCTNPASLRGRSAPLDSIVPSAPFAPGTTIGLATLLVGLTLPTVSTPWIEVRGAYTATCSSADGANVLQITAAAGAPQLHPVPDPTWGLHLVDANIALGDLVRLVHDEARAFVARRHCRFRRGTGWFGCRDTASRSR